MELQFDWLKERMPQSGNRTSNGFMFQDYWNGKWRLTNLSIWCMRMLNKSWSNDFELHLFEIHERSMKVCKYSRRLYFKSSSYWFAFTQSTSGIWTMLCSDLHYSTLIICPFCMEYIKISSGPLSHLDSTSNVFDLRYVSVRYRFQFQKRVDHAVQKSFQCVFQRVPSTTLVSHY